MQVDDIMILNLHFITKGYQKLMNITKLFLIILKKSLHNTTCENLPELMQEQWEELYTISEKHSTEPMIYQQIFQSKYF